MTITHVSCICSLYLKYYEKLLDRHLYSTPCPTKSTPLNVVQQVVIPGGSLKRPKFSALEKTHAVSLNRIALRCSHFTSRQ